MVALDGFGQPQKPYPALSPRFDPEETEAQGLLSMGFTNAHPSLAHP